jgi:hypothetical protein
MFGKASPTRDLIIGGTIAAGVGLLGWLDIATAPTPDAADASIREFGTLLTVVFGLAAALWWNHSARLSDVDAPPSQPVAKRRERTEQRRRHLHGGLPSEQRFCQLAMEVNRPLVIRNQRTPAPNDVWEGAPASGSGFVAAAS